MPEATIAYETLWSAGTRRPQRDPVHAWLYRQPPSRRPQPGKRQSAGLVGRLIGPGKAINTDKFFVVASNMLGSSFGSTNAGSINPQTGEAYSPDFANITIRDIVAAQKPLLDHLGIRHLIAVAGLSDGGYQAFQWAVAYPDFMDAIVPVNTAPGPRSIPTSNWPNCRRGLPVIPNGMAAAITAGRRVRRY
jgi:homoserine O-acetyltransferase